MTTIELTEYQAQRYQRNTISPSTGEDIWRRHGDKIAIDFPTPVTSNQWVLTPQGWVGYIALSRDFGITISPKVPIQNLFGMIEYAYRLKSIHFMKGLYACQSLQEMFDQIAKILSLKILDRGRKGFYRSYLPMSESISYLAGRLNLYHKIMKPWDVAFHCQYEEHTADLVENQILTWTLNKIARMNLCKEQTRQTVIKAYRDLQRLVTLLPFNAQSCLSRFYNRLNEDYQPLHALCRFFLENSGPTHNVGDKSMIPFLIDMDRLFEMFVAEWMKVHLPKQYRVKAQEDVKITDDGSINFKIDLVLYDNETNLPLCVLDTKYKRTSKPTSDDISQVVAYATSKHCSKAILVYPAVIQHYQIIKVGDVGVQCLGFKLDGDLELSGHTFLDDLLKNLIR